MYKILILLLLVTTQVTADDRQMSEEGLELIRNYPHPIICKPIVKVDGVYIISDEDKWRIIPWATFVRMDADFLYFRFRDDIMPVPLKGYICSHG